MGMKVHIIHDSRLFQRYEPLMSSLAEQGIDDIEVWPCMILKNVVESINASHKMIVRYAMLNKLREICIMEDDVMFPCTGAWDYFLSKKPHNYKIYAACNYLSTESPVTKSIVGLHCYFISMFYFDEFLSLPDDKHIDQAISGIDINVCYPFAALQRPGFSSNNREYADYNKILKPQDIYSEPLHNIS